MVKALTWFSRKPGMSIEDFRTYWREEHPRVVLQTAGACRLQPEPGQRHRRVEGRSGSATGWPRPGGTDLDDPSKLPPRHRLSWPRLMADEERVHRSRIVAHTLLVDEVVITDGSPSPDAIKQFTWLKRRSDLTFEQSQSYWRDNHGPLAATVPGMVRYVQNHVIARPVSERSGAGVRRCADRLHEFTLEDARDRRSDRMQLAATRADEVELPQRRSRSPGP